jgi:hypothetical protein
VKFRHCIALLLGIFPIVSLAIDISELIQARSDTAHLYPFGSEHVAYNFFYKSLLHYRLMLSIGVCCAVAALVSVINIFRGRLYLWIAYLPFVAWTITLIMMARSSE